MLLSVVLALGVEPALVPSVAYGGVGVTLSDEATAGWTPIIGACSKNGLIVRPPDDLYFHDWPAVRNWYNHGGGGYMPIGGSNSVFSLNNGANATVFTDLGDMTSGTGYLGGWYLGGRMTSGDCPVCLTAGGCGPYPTPITPWEWDTGNLLHYSGGFTGTVGLWQGGHHVPMAGFGHQGTSTHWTRSSNTSVPSAGAPNFHQIYVCSVFMVRPSVVSSGDADVMVRSVVGYYGAGSWSESYYCTETIEVNPTSVTHLRREVMNYVVHSQWDDDSGAWGEFTHLNHFPDSDMSGFIINESYAGAWTDSPTVVTKEWPYVRSWEPSSHDIRDIVDPVVDPPGDPDPPGKNPTTDTPDGWDVWAGEFGANFDGWFWPVDMIKEFE